MSILILMIPMSIVLSSAFVMAFIWAAQKGQFDDSVTPAHRMLNDEQERNVRE